MNSGVPWQVLGIGRQARESAREAAQRAGMSVGEWLDSIIRDSAAAGEPTGAAESRPATKDRAATDRDPAPLPPAVHDLAAFSDRFDTLIRQLAQLAHGSRRADDRDEAPPRRVTEAIWSLDRRLDQLIAEGRLARFEMERRVDAADRAIASLAGEKPRVAFPAEEPPRIDQALSEIAARQRALEAPPAAVGVAAFGPMSAEPLPRAHTQELSGLEQLLRQINSRIDTLRQPCGLDRAVDVLRDDLAEIGLIVREAMPRAAVEALEAEVRKLSERVDQTRHADIDGALSGVEQGLAEVRDALRALTPAENLVGVDQAVRELSNKIELVAGYAQDPSALRQLEAAIVAMRSIVSHVASNDALASLSQEVRALAVKVDQAAAAGGAGFLATLEQRIAALADALAARNQASRSVPDGLETTIAGLIDRIERIGLARADQAVLGGLEERIAELVRKLDASDARLGQLAAIERGLAELVAHLELQRAAAFAPAEASLPSEVGSLSREVASLREAEQETQDVLELFHGTLGHVVDRLAMIETEIRARPAPIPGASAAMPPPAAAERAAAAASPPPAAVAERHAIDPSLPPDHPLEPGSGIGRPHSPGFAADRIAASEAALAATRPPVAPEPDGKSSFIAAARRAAQAASQEAAAKQVAGAPSEIPLAAGKLARRVGKLRALIGGTSAILLVLATVPIGRSLLGSADQSAMEPTGIAVATGQPAPKAAAATAVPTQAPTAPPAPALAPAAAADRLPAAVARRLELATPLPAQ